MEIEERVVSGTLSPTSARSLCRDLAGQSSCARSQHCSCNLWSACTATRYSFLVPQLLHHRRHRWLGFTSLQACWGTSPSSAWLVWMSRKPRRNSYWPSSGSFPSNLAWSPCRLDCLGPSHHTKLRQSSRIYSQAWSCTVRYHSDSTLRFDRKLKKSREQPTNCALIGLECRSFQRMLAHQLAQHVRTTWKMLSWKSEASCLQRALRCRRMRNRSSRYLDSTRNHESGKYPPWWEW